MAKKFHIYRLFDKREPEITYYVGLTTNLPQRLVQHLSCGEQNPGKNAWIQTPGVEVEGEVLVTKWDLEEARRCEAHWINHYKEMGMPLTNQFIPPLGPSKTKSRPHLKLVKLYLPTDSLCWQDLLDYGRELGMQPAVTVRVVIAEWSQARRGYFSIGGSASPQFTASAPTQTSAPRPKESRRERAKTRGTRFAGTFALGDD